MSGTIEGAIAFRELEKLQSGSEDPPLLVDLRDTTTPPVAGEVRIPLDELPTRLERVPKERQVILFCERGHRSRIGYLLLKPLGYDVRHLAGVPPQSP